MFQKGNSLGGRKKGSVNKTTKVVKERLQKLVENNLKSLQKDLNELEPKDRVNALVQLISYVTPKLKSVEAKVTSVGDMTESQIERLERVSQLMIEVEAETKRDARIEKLKTKNKDKDE
jgi:hypothetical protein